MDTNNNIVEHFVQKFCNYICRLYNFSVNMEIDHLNNKLIYSLSNGDSYIYITYTKDINNNLLMITTLINGKVKILINNKEQYRKFTTEYCTKIFGNVLNEVSEDFNKNITNDKPNIPCYV